ncbi:MAG: hypothetical protein ABI780_03215 [Ardenticatenales bacterium]
MNDEREIVRVPDAADGPAPIMGAGHAGEPETIPVPLFERWQSLSNGVRRLAALGRSAGAALARFARSVAVQVRRLQAWLGNPNHVRRVLYVALPLLIAAGLLAPPISLGTRLWSLTFDRLQPGVSVTVEASGSGLGELEVLGGSIGHAARIDLRADHDGPSGAAPLPPDATAVTDYFDLTIRGPAPREVFFIATVPVATEDQPFIDVYGWDGARWRWLQSQWRGPGRLRALVPTAEYVPTSLVVARAETGRPDVSAVLLPPPSALPAAAAELPILELRAFTLELDDGSLARRPFVPVNPQAQVYGVVDNREDGRVRADLVNNILTRPDSRRRHREEIVRSAQEDNLAGIVLDYAGIDDVLNVAWADFVGLLGDDLRAVGKRLVVTVPMPVLAGGEWSAGTVPWRRIGDGADGVRVRLPDGVPLSTADLDSLVQWCLSAVDRRKLQLAIPVQGQDIVDNIVTPISYGDALARILDIARSDAPARISPGVETVVELPTIKAAELGKDDATQRWRFYYWDPNRRQHTVWLTDVEGLRSVFVTAAYYRIGLIALDGVSNGVDPFLWRMVRTFIRDGEPRSGQATYRLRWQLLDAGGVVIQKADQPLDTTTFHLVAPATEGDYRLSVSLMTGDGELAAPGPEKVVDVGPPPPPTPAPTVVLIEILPTPDDSFVTAVAPSDERVVRPPVTLDEGVRPNAAAITFDAILNVSDTALRAEPSVDARAISTLRIGDRMTHIDTSDDARWWLVAVGATGVKGWVLADFLVTPTPTRAPSATPTPGRGTPTVPPFTPPATPPRPATPRATRAPAGVAAATPVAATAGANPLPSATR